MSDQLFAPLAGSHEALTVSTAVKKLTSTKYQLRSTGTSPDRLTTAKKATITVDDYPIRLTTDGTDPVATTTGHLLAAGTKWDVFGYAAIAAVKMIRDGANDAKVQVSYYGW